MKEIISDYIHLTQMEFILKHPIVVLTIFFVLGLLWNVVYEMKTKRKKHGKEESDTEN